MNPWIILLFLALNAAGIAAYTIAWLEVRRFRDEVKKDFEALPAPTTNATSTDLTPLLSDIQQISRDQAAQVNELRALQNQFLDLIRSTLILNASVKRAAALEKSLAGVDGKQSRREEVRKKAEEWQKEFTASQVPGAVSRGGLMRPGSVPLPGGEPHPQDMQTKKGVMNP
jgi:hypothetical protein